MGHYHLINEEPLIINPIYDNILEYFILVFKRTSTNINILELKAKENSGYKAKKALETIRLFGLGDCDINIHSNDNIHSCRIRVLEQHYARFYNLAKARQFGIVQFMQELKANNNSMDFGFTQFIAREQFEIIK